MRISTKLFSLNLAGVAGLVVVTTLALVGLGNFLAMAAVQEVTRDRTFQAIEAVMRAEVAFKTQVQEWKNILIRGNDPPSFDKYLGQFGAQEAETQKQLKLTAALLDHLGNPEEKAATLQLLEAHAALGTNYREALKGYDQRNLGSFQVVDKAVKGMDRATAEGMTALVSAIEEHRILVSADIAKARGALIVGLEASIIGVSVATTLILMGVGWFMGRRLTLPILQVSTASADLARGNLTVRLPFRRKDEIGTMGLRLNEFLGQLEETLGRVKAEVDQVHLHSRTLMEGTDRSNGATRDIHATADQVLAAIGTQSQALARVSATVEAITRTIEEQDRIIETQTATLGESSASIQEMIANIHSITTNLGTSASEFTHLHRAVDQGNGALIALSETVQYLSNQSEAVLEANETILNLASQTNLLAMNAAIEAAHAGEAGKGFSVVADEIRKLAEQSNLQSKIIQETLGRFRQSIDAAVKVSQETGDSFTGIVQSVATVTRLENEIRNAIDEQAAGGTQVLESLNRMSRITEQVHQGSEGILEGSRSILRGIDELVAVSDAVGDSAGLMVTKATDLETLAQANAVLIRATQEGMTRTEASVAVFRLTER